MEFDQNEQEKKRDAFPAFETERRTDLAPWLEITPATRWKLDQFQHSIVTDCRERFGWQRSRGAEMPEGSPPSIAVHTPSWAHFVLFPHEIGKSPSEVEWHHSYSE